MTPDQQKWLAENDRFSVWRPQPIVSTNGWTDVGYVSPSGKFYPEGKAVPFLPKMRSAGDTLMIIPDRSVKVGREYPIV